MRGYLYSICYDVLSIFLNKTMEGILTWSDNLMIYQSCTSREWMTELKRNLTIDVRFMQYPIKKSEK